jgi:hypothetical protein
MLIAALVALEADFTRGWKGAQEMGPSSLHLVKRSRATIPRAHFLFV